MEKKKKDNEPEKSNDRDPEKLYFPGTELGHKKDDKTNATVKEWEVWPQSLGSPMKAALVVWASGDDNIFGQQDTSVIASSLEKARRLLTAAKIVGIPEGLGGLAPPPPKSDEKKDGGGKKSNNSNLPGVSDNEKNMFVFGLRGDFLKSEHADPNNNNSWESFTIRWDWDTVKGTHVNLSVGSKKYAFMEATKAQLETASFWSGRDAPRASYQDRLINLTKETGYNKDEYLGQNKVRYGEKIGEKVKEIWLRQYW